MTSYLGGVAVKVRHPDQPGANPPEYLTLTFPTKLNLLREAEEACGLNINRMIAGNMAFSATAVQGLLYAGLRYNGYRCEFEEVGDLLQTVQELNDAITGLMQAFRPDIAPPDSAKNAPGSGVGEPPSDSPTAV